MPESDLLATFRHGLLTNLANPKALALFGSLFVVLAPPDAPFWFSGCLLVAIVVTTASWYTLVALTMSTDLIARVRASRARSDGRDWRDLRRRQRAARHRAVASTTGQPC